MRELGRYVYDAVRDTLFIRTVRITLGINNAETLFTRGIPLAYEKLTSYVRATTEKKSEKEYEIRITQQGFSQKPELLEYHKGILEGVLAGEHMNGTVEGRLDAATDTVILTVRLF